MKIYHHLITLILFCIPFSINAQQEKIEFNVVQNDKIIGTAIATKTIDGTKTTYSDDTNMTIHMLTKIKVAYGYDDIFVNGDLIKASVLIFVHEHEHTKAKTFKNNDYYSFELDEDAPVKITEPIVYSTVQLLFEEPIGFSKVYSAEHGKFHKLEKIMEHSYLKTSHEGHENTYHYKNGHLQKVEIQGGVISLAMQRK